MLKDYSNIKLRELRLDSEAYEILDSLAQLNAYGNLIHFVDGNDSWDKTFIHVLNMLCTEYTLAHVMNMSADEYNNVSKGIVRNWESDEAYLGS